MSNTFATTNSAVISALVSVVVSAAVSITLLFLGRRSETIKLQQQLRTTAYADFIRGVAGLAILQRHEPQNESEFRDGKALVTLVADTKARIAIHGGRQCISALANFLRGGNALDSPERARAFAAVCQGFRNDSRPKPAKVRDEDMHFLLFGSEYKDYL
jgi:hypothetical protein